MRHLLIDEEVLLHLNDVGLDVGDALQRWLLHGRLLLHVQQGLHQQAPVRPLHARIVVCAVLLLFHLIVVVPRIEGGLPIHDLPIPDLEILDVPTEWSDTPPHGSAHKETAPPAELRRPAIELLGDRLAVAEDLHASSAAHCAEVLANAADVDSSIGHELLASPIRAPVDLEDQVWGSALVCDNDGVLRRAAAELDDAAELVQ
mmetsp:Transcript_13775/g.28808  ORF Transcript_13775/g.28808 Transcript_13775/m.28808 type:complete len:203 (-) Transcript_13775:1035-1643(-)